MQEEALGILTRPATSLLFGELPAKVTTMPTVNVHQAKTQLSRLLALAEDGEEVVIARRGEPVARLVACKPKGKRRFGAMKGQIVVDDGILDPLPEEELARWEGKSE